MPRGGLFPVDARHLWPCQRRCLRVRVCPASRLQCSPQPHPRPASGRHPRLGAHWRRRGQPQLELSGLHPAWGRLGGEVSTLWRADLSRVAPKYRTGRSWQGLPRHPMRRVRVVDGHVVSPRDPLRLLTRASRHLDARLLRTTPCRKAASAPPEAPTRRWKPLSELRLRPACDARPLSRMRPPADLSATGHLVEIVPHEAARFCCLRGREPRRRDPGGSSEAILRLSRHYDSP